MKKIKFLTLLIALIIGQSAIANCVVCFSDIYGLRWDCTWWEDVNCGDVVPAGYSYNHTVYCKQYMVAPDKPPIIRTDKTDNAYLDDNGRVIKIASDKAVVFFNENTKHTQKDIDAFFKTDDGIVSQKRLEAIAKDLNATIVKSSTPITANYCPACDEEKTSVAKSENSKVSSIDVKTSKSIECPKGSYEKDGECIPFPIKESAAMIYLGGTGSFGIGKTKSQFNIPNLGGIQADIYVPFVRKSIITFGINVSGNYTLTSKNPFSKVSVEPFHIINETSTTVATTTSSSQKNQAFQFAAGPQLNIHIGKHFVVSPIFNIGYMNLSQNDFSAIQTSQVNGTTYTLNLLTQSQTTVSSLLLAPKLRLHYFFNDWIGLWIDGAFNYSNSLKSTITKFTPSIAPDANGLYDEAAIIEGTESTETIKSSFNAVGISGGLVFAIGSRHKSKIDGDGTKAAGGNPTSITKPIKTENQEPTKPTEIYEPPIITMPHNNEVVTLSENTLYIDYTPSTACNVKYKVMVWKNENGKQKQIYDKTQPSTFSGKIEGLKLNKNEVNKLTIKMQAIPCDACGSCSRDKQIYQNSSTTIIKNSGNSNVVNVTTSLCSANGNRLEIKIDSAICTNKNDTKVYGHTTYIKNISISTESQIYFTKLKIDNIIQPIPLSLTPLPASPGSSQSFSFTISGNFCKKDLVLVDSIYTQCTASGEVLPNPIAALDDTMLPCCYCNYCEDKTNSNIITGVQTTTVANNILNVSQSFNLSPKNITKIMAEIIYMDEDTSISNACKTCAKDENQVYHFIETNTAAWNGNATINATAANSSHIYPAKAIEWTSNNQGSLSLNMHIALPGMADLSCCAHKGKIIIRYYFTDKECKTCEIPVPYNYESNNNK